MRGVSPTSRGIRLGVHAARVVFPDPDRAEGAAAIAEIVGGGILALGRYTRQFEAAFAPAHSGDLDWLGRAEATTGGTAVRASGTMEPGAPEPSTGRA